MVVVVVVVVVIVLVAPATVGMSSVQDECRRRGRRTGASAAAAAAAAVAAAVSARSKITSGRSGGSGDDVKGDGYDPQRGPSPPFPSVCRLVEKYTMLIERHRQKQNGLTPPVRRKPSSAMAGGIITACPTTTVAEASSDYSSSLSKSAGQSSPSLSDDAAAWSRLLMDNGGGGGGGGDDGDYDDDEDYEQSNNEEHYRQRRQRRELQNQSVPSGLLRREGEDEDDVTGRRFSCESLASILPGNCTITVPKRNRLAGHGGGGGRVSCRSPRAHGNRPAPRVLRNGWAHHVAA